MTAIEQANELTRQAIGILIAERERIDELLAQLGHGEIKSPAVKRGRPAKVRPLLFSAQSDTTQPASI
jgi:hypothetical protein